MQKQNARKLAPLAAALVIIAALIGLGYYLISNSDSDTNDVQEEQQEQQSDIANVFTVPVEITDTATYQASVQEGQSAFDALNNLTANSDFTFEYDEYDFGVMISSIGGVTPASNQFWKFQINGEDAPVGVSDYELKEGDSLKFVIDEIQF
ncbi:DUF4430 domain-containing protein [Candidatus Dojkabacteria bacterium]|nr:DUF4430 domain-containing protein [Candidatus Dojkabacteria bacterium]